MESGSRGRSMAAGCWTAQAWYEPNVSGWLLARAIAAAGVRKLKQGAERRRQRQDDQRHARSARARSRARVLAPAGAGLAAKKNRRACALRP